MMQLSGFKKNSCAMLREYLRWHVGGNGLHKRLAEKKMLSWSNCLGQGGSWEGDEKQSNSEYIFRVALIGWTRILGLD